MSGFEELLVRDSTVELLARRCLPILRPAALIAPMLLQYAILATHAYAREDLERKLPHNKRLPLACGWVKVSDAPTESLARTVRVGVGRATCCVFRSTHLEPPELVVAFPGMNLRDWADWWAALRCLTRFVPALDDKFRQVRANASHLVQWLRDRYGPDIRLVAVGHSLGGGLAQQAAYATGGFDEVLAFNPTFFTGWYETATEEVRRENSRGLHIFRVHEDGEVLAFLWKAVEWFYPLAREPNPRITRIRTHFYSGFAPFQKHKIVEMSNSFHELASREIRTSQASSRDLRFHIERLFEHTPGAVQRTLDWDRST
jgi:pimeloyl-ACP methyl ester carboxylesterase